MVWFCTSYWPWGEVILDLIDRLCQFGIHVSSSIFLDRSLVATKSRVRCVTDMWLGLAKAYLFQEVVFPLTIRQLGLDLVAFSYIGVLMDSLRQDFCAFGKG